MPSRDKNAPRVPRLPVIGRLLAGRRLLRRWFSRSEWGSRLLRLPRQHGAEPGLILVQIDGLSRKEFERAIERGRMPFIKRLLAREGYALHSMYSGLPATTPAVQGELFYGVKRAVPAFGYFDRQRGRAVRMIEPELAAEVQRRLEAQGEGLLAGGSACSNIYAGGSAEPRFCAAAAGWGELFGRAGPMRILLFTLLNFWSFGRALARTLIELVLAIVDFVKGSISSGEVWRELKFIPSRVAVGVLLRDLATIAAAMDCSRGLPVIQLNYLGYDEHAHRRGPDSRFAHFTLRGIDECLERIWDAAHQSQARMYSMWIYADHGQEKSIPYELKHGRTIADVVANLSSHAPSDAKSRKPGNPKVARADRIGYLRQRRQAAEPRASDEAPPQKEVEVIAVGPVGHIYFRDPRSPQTLAWLAQELTTKAGVPLALLKRDGRVTAWTPRGEFLLPRDAAEVLGADHPLLAPVAEDLVALVEHPDAGDLIVGGWSRDEQPVSYVPENGAHGGAGPVETRAFALLPSDARFHTSAGSALRPLDLREGALQYLGRGDRRERPHHVRPPTTRFRVVTYNVHSCTGLDERLSPARIASVLAHCDADVIALQEIDVRRARSGHVDQAEEIARHLGMQCTFFPALARESEHYGDAILSRLPLRLVKAASLPGIAGKALEPRGAQWVTIDLHGQPVQLINTHLGLLAAEQSAQVTALLGDEWLGHPGCRAPVVLCGDFNFTPRSTAYRRVTGRLRDVQVGLESHRPRGTWISVWPRYRIDHVFASEELGVVAIQTPSSQQARVASDHLPLVVDLEIRVGSAISLQEPRADLVEMDPVEG